MKQIFFKLYGWLFVRPRRWFFKKMANACCLRILPVKDFFNHWHFSNIHWWILYKTVFRFFEVLDDSWRYFCVCENGLLKYKSFIAWIIHRIGSTTIGYVMRKGECFHCASVEGDPVELSMDETGKFFKVGKTWEVGKISVDATENGIEYGFDGITICPKCGYEQFYEASS
jgi:hypothetical protein